MLSEGGVASVTAAYQKLLRSSGLLSLSKCRAGEHLQASSTDHCLWASGCDLLSNGGVRWKAFPMGRITG